MVVLSRFWNNTKENDIQHNTIISSCVEYVYLCGQIPMLHVFYSSFLNIQIKFPCVRYKLFLTQKIVILGKCVTVKIFFGIITVIFSISC